VPLLGVESVRAPFVCCVAAGRGNGIEERLAPFRPGTDYWQMC
jgi:hypothetical protein